MRRIILVDLSSSMGMPVGSRTRAQVMSGILSNVLASMPKVEIYGFASDVKQVTSDLPEPYGSTALHLAFEHLKTLFPKPTEVIVISDGEPDDEAATLRTARALRCPIHTYYCGEESNKRAMQFLKQLAIMTGKGQAETLLLSKPEESKAKMRLLLGGPGV